MRESFRSGLESTILLALCACLALAPTLFAQPERSLRRAPAVIKASTLVSIPGQPIRIPLSPPADFPFAESVWIPTSIPVRLLAPGPQGENMTPVSEVLGFVGRRVSTDSRQPWLGAPVQWEVIQPTDPIPDTVVAPIYWMLFIRLPEVFDGPEWRTPDGGRQRALTLQIGDERFPLRLAPEPSNLPVGRIPQLEAENDRWADLGDLLAPAAMDPTRRWRISLLLDRIPSVRLFQSESLEQAFPLPDPVLRGLSGSLEAEWRSALSDLAQTDPETAARLLARLTLIVQQPDGLLFPAWPTDGRAESELLPALLSRQLSGSERAEAAQRYLESGSTIRATVLDDGGQQVQVEETRRFRNVGETAETIMTAVDASVLITNLSSTPKSPTVAAPGEFDSSILRLGPFASRRASFDPSVVQSSGSPGPDGQQPVAGGMIVRDDGRETLVEFRVAPGPVRRPGQQIGPAFEPWTLASWNADVVRASPIERQTALLLFCDDEEARWKVLVEARSQTGEPALPDTVTIFFGPFGEADAQLRISRDDERSVISSDRWSSVLDVPEEAVARASREGTLAIGFVRQGPAGQISSWPRPLMPGQDEPGRVRLDLRAWGKR